MHLEISAHSARSGLITSDIVKRASPATPGRASPVSEYIACLFFPQLPSLAGLHPVDFGVTVAYELSVAVPQQPGCVVTGAALIPLSLVDLHRLHFGCCSGTWCKSRGMLPVLWMGILHTEQKCGFSRMRDQQQDQERNYISFIFSFLLASKADYLFYCFCFCPSEDYEDYACVDRNKWNAGCFHHVFVLEGVFGIYQVVQGSTQLLKTGLLQLLFIMSLCVSSHY